MLKRYELTDQEWEQISSLLPPENTGKRGRSGKDNRTMLNANCPQRCPVVGPPRVL